MTDKMTDKSKRYEIEALLPFYVNGTLEGEELIAVQAAIEANPDLTQQVKALGHIRERMQAEDVGVSPSDMGFARLSQAIAVPVPANTSFAPTWWRTGMIAACAALVAFGAALQLPRSTGPAPLHEPVYEQASTAQDAPRLQIAFLPQVSMEEVGGMLKELNLSIVAGPSALGFYELAGQNEAALTKALSVLEARIDQVDYVDLLQ
jgi:hypothetical protein